MNYFALLEFQARDSLEALFEVRLHAHGVLGFAEYLQKFLVGEKEKPGKAEPLGLKVRVQSLLHDLKVSMALLETGHYLLILGHLLHQRLFGEFASDVLPDFVNYSEL